MSGDLSADNVDITDYVMVNVLASDAIAVNGTLEVLDQGNIDQFGFLFVTENLEPFIVTNVLVEVISLETLVVADIGIVASDIYLIQIEEQALVLISSVLMSEQKPASVVVVAQMSDGNIQLLPANEISLKSLNNSIISINQNNTITPKSDGSGRLLEVTWSTEGAGCRRTLVQEVEISVMLRQPIHIYTIPPSLVALEMTIEGDPAALLDIPTSIEIQVIAQFENGDTVDIASLAHQTHPTCLLYTSPSPRDRQKSRMPSSA